ncbi:hypothetical protein AMS57_01045 [Pseudoalteromonas undina]|uniref:hypothetical protein n=1 Tax=Pseudoalteromonas undina TaxID=43660 RepID=UPI0006BB3E00|nr:hypothetical protein [Pseudoalteromonas undina]KPH92147.1 hypothetical protein AMS57_01045 [Pseudoalteromonas undina]
MSYSSGTPKKEEALGDGLSSMHHTTKRLLNFKKEEFDDIAKFQSALDQALSDPTDRTYKMAVSRAYNTLHKHHLSFTNEEQLIRRMERNSQIRNTFFRALTTLSIGFSVMLVYWVAAKWEIAMPLMRIPL